MNTLTPALTPAPSPTTSAPQTPQSQYLAAALKSLSAQPAPMTGGALGSNLLASALLHGAQDSQNAQANPGQDVKPLGQLFNMGKQAMGLQPRAQAQPSLLGPQQQLASPQAQLGPLQQQLPQLAGF